MGKFVLRPGLKVRGYPWSNKHLITLEEKGLFPRRVYLGGGKTPAWVEDELDAYDAARIAERDATAR